MKKVGKFKLNEMLSRVALDQATTWNRIDEQGLIPSNPGRLYPGTPPQNIKPDWNAIAPVGPEDNTRVFPHPSPKPMPEPGPHQPPDVPVNTNPDWTPNLVPGDVERWGPPPGPRPDRPSPEMLDRFRQMGPARAADTTNEQAGRTDKDPSGQIGPGPNSKDHWDWSSFELPPGGIRNNPANPFKIPDGATGPMRPIDTGIIDKVKDAGSAVGGWLKDKGSQALDAIGNNPGTATGTALGGMLGGIIPGGAIPGAALGGLAGKYIMGESVTRLSESEISNLLENGYSYADIAMYERYLAENGNGMLNEAGQDYDGDGEVESGEEEYLGSRDRAIKNNMSEKIVFYTDDEGRKRRFDDGR